MQILIYLCLIGYVICEYDLEKTYNFLVQTKGDLLSGQWTNERDHLIYIKIVFDNKNLILQVYPQNNSMLHEKHQFTLKYELNNSSYSYDSQKNLLTWKDIKVDVSLGNNDKHPPFACSSTLFIDATELENSTKLVVFSDFDQDCGVTKERIKLFIYSEIAYQTEVQFFTLVVLSISIIQIVSSAKYLKSDPVPNKGASLTLSIILTQDIYICLFSSLLFDIRKFFYFTPCLVIQLLVILYDLKIKSKLSKAQFENPSYNVVLTQFVELVIMSYLFINIRHSVEITIINLFLTPQIIYTCFSRERQKFSKHYIGMIMPRSIYSIYARGSTDNILQLAQRLHIVYTIILILSLQLIIYYCQCKYGWFIIRKNQFNYFIEQTTEHAQTECAICLNPLSEIPEGKLNDEPIINKALSQAKKKQLLMNTPCNHQYHPICLTQWMEINLICPLCKNALPQIY